jgi:hypothetical protein
VRLALLILLTYVAAPAEDHPLAALRATLVWLRPHANDHRESRGATSELTVAKHQLRDWIESRLPEFAQNGDENMFANELGDRLRESDLLCEPQCPMSILGFLDNVRISREREFLIILTSVGIWCGYDDSAYAYKWTANRWHRIWESEQDTYAPKRYLPQSIHAVHISPPDQDGSSLLLSLGSQPGCSSAFQPVYYRIWRIRDHQPKLLLDKSEFANVGEYPPTTGTAEAADVRIELTLGGTGYGFAHKAVRHYAVHGDRTVQVDPIATSPRDFVEEWLGSPWAQSAARSDSVSLKSWHQRLHREDGMGDFPGPTLRCSGNSDLWQVSTHLHDAPEMYYLVRLRPPDHFAMAGVSVRPYPGCTREDEH